MGLDKLRAKLLTRATSLNHASPLLVLSSKVVPWWRVGWWRGGSLVASSLVARFPGGEMTGNVPYLLLFLWLLAVGGSHECSSISAFLPSFSLKF